MFWSAKTEEKQNNTQGHTLKSQFFILISGSRIKYT